jgi:hypothetical protein
MEEFFKKITHIYKGLSFTERERIAMRLQLSVFIDEHPAQAPFMVRVSGRTLTAFNKARMHFKLRYVSAMLVFVLVTGVGTSYAAVDALPGSPLFALKVSLDESVERATVSSSQSETQWTLTLTNRRLQEAEKLAAMGTLTPSNANIVVTQLNTDTANFNATVSTLATSSLALAQVANAQSDLDAALSAHVQVLVAIASSSESLGNQVAPVLAIVRAHASVARAARATAIADLDTQSSGTVKVAAKSEMTAAISKLNTIRALASSSMTAVASAGVSSSQAVINASSSEAAIAAGNDNLAQGHFREAFEAFQSVVQAATEVQVGAQAQANLGNSIVMSPIVPTTDASSNTITAGAVATSSLQVSATSTKSSNSPIDPTGKASDAAGK